jgi:hypothetical protein
MLSRHAMLRRLTLAALAALLVVTSSALAVARGRGSPAGLAELCAGAGTVMVALDADGNPTGPAHLCPDAVLFVADGVAAPAPERPGTAARRVDAVPILCEVGRAPLLPSARGPPVRA